MSLFDTQTLAIFFLVAVAIGGFVWVLLYPSISGERTAEERRMILVQPALAAQVSGARVQKARRESIEETLKEVERKNSKIKRVPLNVRMSQAGLSISKRQFFLIVAASGLATFALASLLGVSLMPSVAFTFAATLGLPFWVLNFLKKRREFRFIDAFPDAIDVIVRGIKSGLPVTDSLRIVAADAPEPVRSEFRQIIETQVIGVPLPDACAKLYERVPLPEANFFGIVIAIQQRSGGNLSEALGNLSRVLRDRKRMKAKIRALSMEAKASAAIIAALPLTVMLLVYLTSPQYIELLWLHPTGRLLLVGCATWMLIGVFVMRKMINFDF